MGKSKEEKETVLCPVGRFFADMEKIAGKKSPFFQHLNQSRVELLKAVRTLLDEKIEGLEKKASKAGGKKITKIKVE